MPKRVLSLEGLCVDVQCIIMGPIDNNVYLVSDGAGTFVVDPTQEPEAILEVLGDRKLDAIVVTHGHSDHVGAVASLQRQTGATVYAYEGEKLEEKSAFTGRPVSEDGPISVDRRVKNGDVIKVGNMEWKVIHTPGHTKGGMCLFIIPQFGNHADGMPVLLSGDTLFEGTIGRTDFEGGSLAEMRASLKKLAQLPDDTVVLPGHEGFTTIGAERRRVFAAYGGKEA